MKEHLEKRKRNGIIDFIQVPINYGWSHSEFLGFDIKRRYFFVIFYDNKYRENDFDSDSIERYKSKQADKLSEYEKGLNDIGIYNMRNEYEECKKQLDFIEKYD